MEKKKRWKENNGGYSLVELIIVMAIIVVLSAIAFVTITMIHSAKAKEAAITFEAELKECQAKARGQVMKSTAGIEPYYQFALQLRLDSDGKYYVKNVGRRKGSSGVYNVTMFDTRGQGKGADLSSYIYVIYQSDAAGAAERRISTTYSAYISFDKNGMCIGGSGTYKFYRESSGSLISTVTVNKNGSIQIK